ISPQRLEAPLPLFSDNAGGVGLINLYPDRDNIVRSVPVATQTIQENSRQYHLSLSLESAALYRGGVNKIEFPDADTTVLSRVQEESSEEIFKVIAPAGKMYLNYVGGRYAYPMLPFWKIIRGEFNPREVRDKVIFVGDTSLTSHDYFLTPFRRPSRVFVQKLQEETLAGGELTNVSTFGIEIHAQAFQTILENSFIRKLPIGWSLLLIFGVGLISGRLLFQDRKVQWSLLLLIGLSAGVWGGSQYLFSARHLWIELAPLETVIFINFIFGLAFQRAIALYNRNKVKGAFQQYVSGPVVEEMLKHPEKLHLGGERKFLSILFSDIRGFTSISEGMESQGLVEFLNEYLTEMTEIVLKYDGTLDKYMGDAIMAIYGAPIEQPDHPERACDSALEMMKRLRELQAIWHDLGKPAIDIGIGINSGPMTAGNMGSEKRFDYTVMGDNVNLGSRLEGTNKQHGTNIIISEFTYQEVKDEFITRELDLVRVKGKLEPVKIYELIARKEQTKEQIVKAIRNFEAGLLAYRASRWSEAVEQFEQSQTLFGSDWPSQLYIQRCQDYQNSPPPENWDGVYVMKTK
ncbi:MAG: CHASE2 domain-containing protein, partial [bacterium]|nr:CHASE2 domain-containing protein [bacterium]